MLADQRVVPGQLDKVQCAQCGVVANARPLSRVELDQLQPEAGVDEGTDSWGQEERRHYTASGAFPRSEGYLQLIMPHVPADCGSVLEVDCGCGDLLARLAEQLPGARLRGVSGSVFAVRSARERGLDVTQGLVTESVTLPASDCNRLSRFGGAG